MLAIRQSFIPSSARRGFVAWCYGSSRSRSTFASTRAPCKSSPLHIIAVALATRARGSNYVLQRTPGTFYVSTYLRGPAPLNTALAANRTLGTMPLMGKVEHLEHQIAALSPSELAAFRAWYCAFDSDAWDRQLEQDVTAGKLDALAEQALEAHRSGKTSPL